jgi:LacI family transcriptional regulator
MTPSQDQIADRLNLSRSTVSRSLAGHPAIHPQTRARVLAMADDLGYQMREHNRGRQAKLKSVSTVGVLVGGGSFQHSPHPEAGYGMLAGISDAASARDTILDTQFISQKTNEKLLADLKGGPGKRSYVWRGVILLYPHPFELVDALAKRIPVVSLVHQYPGLPVDCIDTDSFSGMFDLIANLKAQGHQRIGFLTRTYQEGMPSWVFTRFGGFVQALTRHGLPFIPSAVVNAVQGSACANDDLGAKIKELARKEKVTAFVCAADHQVFMVIRQLAKLGMRVPEDISLTGFDGTECPPDLKPVCTISNPLHDMGIAAFLRLVNRVQNPSQAVRHILHQGKFSPGCTVKTISV